MPKLTIEEIAEIRNALTVIQLNADCLTKSFSYAPIEIIKQVKRINRLLPKIKFEGGKK